MKEREFPDWAEPTKEQAKRLKKLLKDGSSKEVAKETVIQVFE